MKIRIGIVGYGNLGKAIEAEVLKNKNFKLIAIFSRRTLVSKYNTLVEPYDAFVNYKGKIDVMMMCGGSANDIELQLPEIAKNFNTINSFDTHLKLAKLISKTNEINVGSQTISISACGWDPGLFSVIRSIMFAISGEKPVTFWGKGISMGHSDAIRRIDNVEDAVQFTVPNKKAIYLAKKNKLSDDIALHQRECYVVAKKEYQSKIEYDIKNIPNYFKGQQTSVSFISNAELLKLKRNMAHKGVIFMPLRLAKAKKAHLEFKAQMDSNAMFTAKIMTRYIFAVMNLASEKCFGAYLPIDIATSKLFSKSERELVIKHLC